MISIIQPVKSNITPILNGDLSVIFLWLSVIFLMSLTAFFIGNYGSKRYKTDKKKTDIAFVVLSVVSAILILCFFGLSAATVKGCILSLIFVLSSFEDIRTHECDDYLHVMILVAGFIGIQGSDLPGMLLSGFIAFALIMGTLLLTKSEIGGADIKFSTACAFVLGVREGIIGLILGLIIAIVVNLIKNKKNKSKGFPMLPYLAVGFMTAYFI